MAEVKKISYEDKTIYVSVHQGLQGNEIIKNQEKLLQMILDDKVEDALTITDMRGVYVSPAVDKGLRALGNQLMDHSSKAAVIGMASGIKKVIIYAFLKIESKPMRLFDTFEEAQEWLVED